MLIGSIVVNYLFGSALARRPSRQLLGVAVVFNLALIGYFKYLEFLAESLGAILSIEFQVGSIALPLAISFFTFQQIAYQVDVYRGRVKDRSFLHYSLFVTFFPQLIAGPIVHHQEVIPQMAGRTRRALTPENLIVGSMIFLIGLYKKVVIADGFAPFADMLFDNAQEAPTFIEAWGGSLAYTLQLYFDFSGYSDMAIGLARMFGVKLPVNFNSPYKAGSIIEFWQNWHITLSRFLRDYVYIPLGGNRLGEPRRYTNVMVTMLLGGLWHGAGWTFVAWGAYHSALLAVNHYWRKLTGHQGKHQAHGSPAYRFAGWALTFLAVAVGWVLFRAESWGDAIAIYQAMIGMNGFGALPSELRVVDSQVFYWLAVMLPFVWLAPNTQEISTRWTAEPALGMKIGTLPHPAFRLLGGGVTPFVLTGALASVLVLIAGQSGSNDFIYMVF